MAYEYQTSMDKSQALKDDCQASMDKSQASMDKSQALKDKSQALKDEYQALKDDCRVLKKGIPPFSRNDSLLKKYRVVWAAQPPTQPTHPTILKAIIPAERRNPCQTAQQDDYLSNRNYKLSYN